MVAPAGVVTGEPLVAVCRGHRCAALGGGCTATQLLREAVSRTRGAVLISTSCLGPCAQGPVVVLATEAGEVLMSTTWLGPLDGPESWAEVARIVEHGDPVTDHPLRFDPSLP